MDKDNLTVEHIAPYLPYKLRGVIDGIDYFTSIELLGIRNEFIIWNCGWNNHDCFIKKFKPILRPLSDLMKKMKFNGKEFVPLVELYRNSYQYYNSKDLDYEFIDSWGAKGNILKVYQNRDKDEYTEFVYSNLSFRKDTRYDEGSFNFGMYLPHPIRVNSKIHNIYFLQQLLYKWHFDIFGLIDKGMAIDINVHENKEVDNG